MIPTYTITNFNKKKKKTPLLLEDCTSKEKSN